jgi:hypothetical protein
MILNKEKRDSFKEEEIPHFNFGKKKIINEKKKLSSL